MTFKKDSFCRFFSKMVTMSVAVQAPSAINSSSIAPGAVLDSRSESVVMAWPEGLIATNFCSPIHCTDAVCMLPPGAKGSHLTERTSSFANKHIPRGYRVCFANPKNARFGKRPLHCLLILRHLPRLKGLLHSNRSVAQPPSTKSSSNGDRIG